MRCWLYRFIGYNWKFEENICKNGRIPMQSAFTQRSQRCFRLVTGGTKNFHLAIIAQGGVGNRSPPVRSRGEAPIGDWRKSPPEAEAACRNCLQMQKRSKFENFTQFASWFLTSMFYGGTKRPIWGVKPPSPCLVPPVLTDIGRQNLLVPERLLETADLARQLAVTRSGA